MLSGNRQTDRQDAAFCLLSWEVVEEVVGVFGGSGRAFGSAERVVWGVRTEGGGIGRQKEAGARVLSRELIVQ